MTEANRKRTMGLLYLAFAAAFVSAVSVISVISAGAQTTTTLPPKTNVYPTVATPDPKLPTVILTNSDGQQVYLRLFEYADGTGLSLNYNKYNAPSAPELNLKAGQVFTLKFINGQAPPLYSEVISAGEIRSPINILWEPGPGSDSAIHVAQLGQESPTEARFFLDTHVPASDDESVAAHGHEEMTVTINYPDTVAGNPLWVNYKTLVNIEGNTTR
jgi:hypothetical protein